MIESDSSPSDNIPFSLKEVSDCEGVLQRKLRSANTISFRSFMEIALYHPEHGYYSSEQTRVGNQGDFITSVSVGCAFGAILAHRILKLWENLGRPTDFKLIEMGANRADLAKDICTELLVINPEFPLNYHIIEPLDKLRKLQSTKLLDFKNIVHLHRSVDSIKPGNGIFLSNELFDALPVERIQFRENHWQQMFIELQDNQFSETWKKIDNSELAEFCSSLGNDFPDAYTTEFRPHLSTLHHQISGLITRGMILSIDYGFPRSHFYDTKRIAGTLQTYQNQTKSDNPLEHVGEQDITAHVDFTQLVNNQIREGFKLYDFSSQSRYLTRHGKDWLLSLEENFNSSAVSKLKQFQTLTHPDMMGGKFHLLETIKGYTPSEPPLTEAPHEILECSS